jgi:streptogramin lyase
VPRTRTRRSLLPLLASAAALLACPGAASAGVTEFSAGLSHDSAPADITPGPDGKLWFTTKDAVGSITVSGTISEYKAGTASGFPSGRVPRQVTAGPNGSLWFTVQGTAQAITRYTPATNVIVETKLAAGTKPTAVTAGPDGNVWFIEQGTRKIARITPAGTLTEFDLGLGRYDVLNDIADDNDGGVWFTVSGKIDDQGGGPKVGRIDAATGIVERFTTDLTDAAPDRIAAASDGRLYFTDSATPGSIRRITRSGTIATYRAGVTAGSRPAGIAEGGDGALWFTASAKPGRLGRLWPATAAITEFAGGSTPGFTRDAAPAGIARGPDGNVWFTERANPGRIGRVTVPPLADLEIESVSGSNGGAATGVLQATIAANSQPTTYVIEYGPDASYGSRTEVRSAGSDAAPVERVVDLPLPPGREYHARIVADNGSGQSVSDDVALLVAENGEVLAAPPAGAAAGPDPAPGETPAAAAEPAPPTLGTRVVIRPVSGTVRFKPRGAAAYFDLDSGVSLPVGSLVDTRHGRVSLESARNARGRTQTGIFWGGVFQVRQRRRNRGITDLHLRGSRFTGCGGGVRAGASALAREAKGRRRAVRHLWGKDSHARFRTHGRDSVATVRGTRWLTTDRCDGTLTRVREGKVLVRDLRRRHSVLLTAGHAYLARHKRP